MKTLSLFLPPVLQFFFPRVCLSCRFDVSPHKKSPLCLSCWKKIKTGEGLSCEVCGIPLPGGGAHCFRCKRNKHSFEFIRNAGIYEGVLKDCLIQFKYKGKEALSEFLGELLVREWPRFLEIHNIDIVVPVPLYFWREHVRGYNQSKQIADIFCQALHLKLNAEILFRQRKTKPQVKLEKEERFLNLKNAFWVRDPQEIKGKNILLVDDVCTTGATIDACAKTLIKAGAQAVSAYTVARQL